VGGESSVAMSGLGFEKHVVVKSPRSKLVGPFLFHFVHVFGEHVVTSTSSYLQPASFSAYM